jgi:hypothetical protein
VPFFLIVALPFLGGICPSSAGSRTKGPSLSDPRPGRDGTGTFALTGKAGCPLLFSLCNAPRPLSRPPRPSTGSG